MKLLIRHPLVIVFVVGLLGLGAAVSGKVQENEQSVAVSRAGAGGPSAVNVARVTQQTFADRVESVGTSVANESVNLSPKVSDTISRIGFEDGDFASSGEILVELTNASEAARLAEAQATMDEATRQYERLQNLLADKLVSATDLDAARSRSETAQARLDGVIVAMDDRLIRAPFSGVLGFRNVSEGSLVNPNTVITTLDDISTIKLDFSISEVYLAQLEIGQTISARSIVYRDREFIGTVQTVSSRVDPVTRSVQVRALIDNKDSVLRPGMLLTVSLELNAAQATVIPEQALIPRAGRQYVFLVQNDNVVREVEVEIGRRRPGYAEILTGLSPGDVVAIEGMAQLRPGQSVRILNSAVTELAAPTTDTETHS